MSRPRLEVTIYDVARLADVAPSTVSRTFSRPGRVSAETAAKVRAAAVELGYRANTPSQAPNSGKTRLLAIMVADIANPFYTQVVQGAQIASAHAGYELILADFRESADRERSELERLLPVVDGIVSGSSRMTDAALRQVAKLKPMAVVSREVLGIASVIPDNRSGVQAAMDLLHSLGHTAVTYVAGPEASWADQVRYRTICDINAAVGYSVQRIGPFLPTFEDGMAASRQLIDRPPTAVIAHNDLVAIGVMHGLRAAGVRLPQDISVVGIDDVLAARLVTPQLTTIALPAMALGMTAVRHIVAIINGAVPKVDQALTMPVQLKIRGSTGPVRASRTLR